MKNKIKKTVSALIAAVILLPSLLSSCADNSEVVMSYKGHKITTNMYSYWLSTYKAMFLYSYTGAVEDNPDFWNTMIGEFTAAGYFTLIIEEAVKKNLVALALFDEYKLKLSSEQKRAVDLKLDELVSTAAGGNRAYFNSIAANVGVNYSILKEIYLMDAKIAMVYDYLYGTYGAEKITDAQRDDYYKANYVNVKHILIGTVDKTVTDENGNPVVDQTTGAAKTEPITEEELAAKNEIIAQIDHRLGGGESFETLLGEFSEDEASKYFSNGYFFTASTNFIPEVIQAAFEMNAGETRKIESQLYGTHYIKKFELPAGAYGDGANADFFKDFESVVTAEVYQNKLRSFIGDVYVDTDIKSQFSIRSAAVNAYF